MKRVLPPLLFFVTIAFMGVFLGYKRFHQPPTARYPEQPTATYNPSPQPDRLDEQALLARQKDIQDELAVTVQHAEKIKAQEHLTPDDEKTLASLVSRIEEMQVQLQTIQKALDEDRRWADSANPHIVPPSSSEQPSDIENPAKRYETFMPMVITAFLALVAVGLLIWRKEDAEAQKWVYSTFGAILGYWLKGGA